MLYLLTAILSITVINAILIVLAVILGFKIFEPRSSYRISRPFLFDEALQKKLISPALRKIEKGYPDKVRFYSIWLQLQRIQKEGIEGSLAELGVYRGETAKIIHLISPSRRFHLFDTFSGFAEQDLTNEVLARDNKNLTFADTSLEDVKEYVEGNDNLIFHVGYFPDTTHGIEDKFAFVSIDADLYQPTIGALQFFYSRLVPGGAILIHDYNHSWPGVRKAVDEFARTIPETIMEVADWQGSALILKNRIF